MAVDTLSHWLVTPMSVELRGNRVVRQQAGVNGRARGSDNWQINVVIVVAVGSCIAELSDKRAHSFSWGLAVVLWQVTTLDELKIFDN